jgi:hypothetical protein
MKIQITPKNYRKNKHLIQIPQFNNSLITDKNEITTDFSIIIKYFNGTSKLYKIYKEI